MKRTISLCLALLLVCSILVPAVFADVEPGYDQAVLQADTGAGLKKMPYQNTYEQYYAAGQSVSSALADGFAPLEEKTVVRTYAIPGESENRSVLITVPYEAYITAYERKAEGQPEKWLDGQWETPGTTYLLTLSGEDPSSEYPTICLKDTHWDSVCLYVQDAAGALREILQFTYGVNTPSLLDVSDGAWYASYARTAALNGWLVGNSARMFRPGEAMTRANLFTAIWKMEGSPLLASQRHLAGQFFGAFSSFIPAYAQEAYLWAFETGILNGAYSIIHAGEAISRQDALTVLYRYAAYRGLDVSAQQETNILSYDDSFQLAEYALPAIHWACDKGLVEGVGSSLQHDAPLTRAQAAKLLCLFAKL